MVALNRFDNLNGIHLERRTVVPITLKCSNGHQLTANESNAGKTGKCPVCKAPVRIPVLHQTEISDSAIMHILGNAEPQTRSRVGTTIAPPRVAATPRAAKSTSSASSATLPHIKLCPSCEREIDMGYHICPYCHTYITGLNDF